MWQRERGRNTQTWQGRVQKSWIIRHPHGFFFKLIFSETHPCSCCHKKVHFQKISEGLNYRQNFPGQKAPPTPQKKKWPKFTTWSETAYKPIYDVYMSSQADPGFNGYVALYSTVRGWYTGAVFVGGGLKNTEIQELSLRPSGAI